MTVKEAISLMKFRIYTAEEIAGNQGLDDMRMAVEALEKKLLKNPMDIDNDCGTFKCPSCGGLIYTEDKFETHRYCLLCGQALKWDERHF